MSLNRFLWLDQDLFTGNKLFVIYIGFVFIDHLDNLILILQEVALFKRNSIIL